MKTLIKTVLSVSVLVGSTFLATTGYSATYAAHDCVAQTGSLKYSDTGAQNASTTTSIDISCPFVRLKDGANTAAGAVVYFVNDGKTKSCFFDNYNIDTGGLWSWRSGNANTRMVIPALSPTKPWSPFVLNCTLPASSKITGYYLSE